MGTITYPATTITTAGVHSPARTLPGKVKEIILQLTSPVVDSTTGALDWDLQANTGGFSFGIEYSSDAGASWRWLVHQPGDAAPPDSYAIGTRGKGGAMPWQSPAPEAIKGIVGDRVRLSAATVPFSSAPQSAPAVQVGAVVTYST